LIDAPPPPHSDFTSAIDRFVDAPPPHSDFTSAIERLIDAPPPQPRDCDVQTQSQYDESTRDSALFACSFRRILRVDPR
jgi:hypothetical protein